MSPKVKPAKKKVIGAAASTGARLDVDSYLAAFRTKFKDAGAIFATGKNESLRQAVEVIPSDIISLDLALGVGGLPRGRVVEIFGPESGGKTTLALQFAIKAQQAGGMVHFIDAEHALDLDYAAKLGYDDTRGLISQPNCGEEALEIVDFAITAGMDVVIIDSVAALTPRAEIEGEMGDPHMGLQARLMSQALRKLTYAKNNRTVTIFINQLRMKLGLVFGNPETTPGGNALKFYASVRLDVRKGEVLKDGDEVCGHKLKIKVVKNKVAVPFRSTEIALIYGQGFDELGDLISAAVARGVIEKNGSFLSFAGKRLGNGFDNSRDMLAEDPKTAAAIEDAVRASTQPVAVAAEPLGLPPPPDQVTGSSLGYT